MWSCGFSFRQPYFPTVKLQAIATAVGDGTTLNDRYGGLGKYGHALVGVYGVG